MKTVTSGNCNGSNTDIFTGKAQAYAAARPGYPDEAIAYICSLVPKSAVFADIGAGTGKFTELVACRNYELYAVEPNQDMRGELESVLAPYANARIVPGTAEATTLPNVSVDVITCAQALHWFDPHAFAAECRRILRPGGIVITIYNQSPGGVSVGHSKDSTDAFYINPTVREFPNPIMYTRSAWLQYMTSHSHDPLPTDEGYAAHMAEVNAIFDSEAVDGILKRDVVTRIYSAKIEEVKV
jgi:ubiquinone/menaquinone biosynthesis C-methylase UbiE